MEESEQKKSALRKHKECLNCHHRIEDENFCPKCGQKNDDKQATLKEFFKEFIGDFFTFDHKFFRSFKPLLLKPGYLTNQYNSGKRTNYILPMRLYFFISVIFFFILSITESNLTINNSGIDDRINTDSLFNHIQKSTKLTSEATFKIVLDISNNFDEIRPHANGKNWLNYFKNELSFSDSLSVNIAYELYLPFRIKKDSNAINSRPLIQHINNKLIVANLDLSIAKIDSIIFDLENNYQISRRYYDPNVKSPFVIKRIFNKTIKDTVHSTFLVKKLLTQIKFRKTSDDYTTDYLVGDKSDNRLGKFGNQVGSQLAYQVEKIRRMNKGTEFITQEFISNLPKVIFFLLPLFALLLKLFFYKSRVLYINHLILTLHVHSVMFIYLSVAALIGNDIGQVIALLLSWIHIYMSILTVYKQSYIISFFKMAALSLIYGAFCTVLMLITILYLIMNL